MDDFFGVSIVLFSLIRNAWKHGWIQILAFVHKNDEFLAMIGKWVLNMLLVLIVCEMK